MHKILHFIQGLIESFLSLQKLQNIVYCAKICNA
jgi:hypothetical protein